MPVHITNENSAGAPLFVIEERRTLFKKLLEQSINDCFEYANLEPPDEVSAPKGSASFPKAP
jgi:hypothetical protein